MKSTLKITKIIFYLILIFFSTFIFCQNQELKGFIFDQNEFPISQAEISINNKTTKTNKKGYFSLNIDNQDFNYPLKISHQEFETLEITLDKSKINEIKINLLPSKNIQLKEIIFQKNTKSDLNSIGINSLNLDKNVSINGGIEDILKTLPYVNSNTELSSQYMVRGGNFDENLVYINGIEMYKPFLVRSGQQEGLSVINPEMTSLINFSAGGFESKYGDKMSSVLDITYKKPKKFEGSLETSLIGANLTLGFADKKQKFTGITGVRYRNTNLLLKTFDTNTDFNPVFSDLQTYLSYKFNPKWNISFTGNISNNIYEMIPRNRETDFGTLSRPIRLTVFYDGKEKDQFITQNGAFTLNFKPTNKIYLSADLYAYHGIEQEYFTITSAYLIQDVDPETGQINSSIDAGRQRNHARNDLDFLVYGTKLKGKYIFDSNSNIEFGIQTQKENIRDLSNEWELIDKGGYSQPEAEFNGDLNLKYHISSNHNLNTNRYLGFIQWNKKLMWNENKIMINSGIRYNNWDFNKETLISPRIQLALKPNWEKDFLFRFATGIYYQAPIYKEIKDLLGDLNQDIKSQKSYHFIFGTDYEFKMANRSFKLTSEIYYKSMTDLIPYYVDNVRIKYTGQNNSIGKSYGIDTRLNGEFVKGAESWVSFSYAKSEENIDGKGWINRPTNQRFHTALFFQDYMKFFPSMKINVQIVYSSGLPNGAPLFTDPYKYQSNLADYKRVDLGFTKVFIDQSKKKMNSNFFKNFKEVSLGIEAFNIFNIKNTISNQWIQDVNTNVSYSVPNRLTGRFFNIKLYIKF